LTDIAPDFDFTAASQAAEAEALGETPEPDADVEVVVEAPEAVAGTVEEPVAEGRPRNEDGTFKAKEPEDGERLYAGQYKTVEELERAVQEKQQFADRLANELGETRRAMEERFTGLEERIATPITPQTPITRELIEENPGAATQLAFQQGNQQALAIAYEAWKYEEPADAASWRADVINAQRMQQMQQQYEQRLAQIEQRVAPAESQALDTEWAHTFRTIEAKYPDLHQYKDEMTEIATEFPQFASDLRGDPESRGKALESLYLIARGRTADTLRATQGEIAQQTAVEAQRVREDAFVASQTSQSAEAPLTYEERETQKAIESVGRRQSLWDGAWEHPGKPAA
jgi:uncharacterized coiled-coil protein SlyX